jgi:hypothetical protein
MSLAAAAPRLARLVPRLGSTFDAEVVATAKAIERTLKASGADLCDLAALIAKTAGMEAGPRTVSASAPAPTGPAPRWRTMPEAERIRWLDRLDHSEVLNGWERRFLDDLARKFASRSFQISDAQGAVLERMIEKLWRAEGGH